MDGSISFGTLSTTNGTTRLGGTASKLDTESILEATYEAKRLPAVRLENRTTRNEEKIAAFEEMRSLLGSLKTAVDGLRNPPGFFGAEQNIFETKQAFFSSSSTVPPGEIAGVAIANDAAVGSFDLTVMQLASAEKLSTTGTGAADATLGDAWNGGAAFAGTLDVGLAGGTAATIAVDSGMTVYDLRDQINAERATTGVRASVLKVADDDFRLVMTAEETGKAITLGDSTGIAGGFPSSQLQAAEPAIFEIDGVEITRLQNQADDILPGVTINLFKADVSTTISVSVEPSLGDIKERIAGFVEAYNGFRDFVDVQSAVDANGQPAADAVLFGDRTMRSLVSGLGAVIGGGVAGLDPDAMASLRAVGVELDANNRLTIDDAELDNALLTKLDDVRGVFEFRLQSSSNELAIFSRTNALAANAFAIEITDADADGTPEAVTIDGVAAEFDGSTIKGANGTPYEGLEFLWTGKGSTTIDVEVSQGIADRVYNFVGPTTDMLNGSITQAIDSLKDINGNYSKQIERIEDRALRARELLLERFTAMEAAMSLANTMLTQIRAQIDAMTADS
jgi:flagellar hook-associated protein 2